MVTLAATVLALSLKGSALHFDGTGTIHVPDAPALHLVHGLSIEAWINPDPGIEGPQAFSYFLSRNYDDGGYGMLTRREPTRSIEATGWNARMFTNARVEPGHWTHVAFSTDNQISKLYIDGRLVGTQKLNHPYRDNDLPLILGGSPFFNGPETCNWRGGLAEVRVWSYPRSERQIRRNMHRRLTGHERRLAAYYPLSAAFPTDRTGKTSGAAIVGTPPTLVPGPPLR